MNIAIVGAGAMGCRFGAALFATGYEVILVDRWQAHVEQINQYGLSVENEDGVHQLRIKAVAPECVNTPIDLIIVFTKSVDTEEMIARCQATIDEDTSILTLQNGIGNLDILARYVQEEQLFAGTTTYAANLQGPGSVAAFGSGYNEIMYMGGKRKNGANQIVSLFQQAGLHAGVSENVIKSIWEKAAFNAILNPLCTLTLSSVAQVGSYSGISEVIDGMLNEIDLVAKAEQVDFDKEKVKQTIYRVCHPSMSGNHYSSMYYDIQNRRKTEVDFLNGAIWARAKKHHIQVPHLSLLYHLMKILEQSACRS